MAYNPYPPQPYQSYQPSYPGYATQRSSAPFSVHVVAFFIYLGGVIVLLAAIGIGVMSVAAPQYAEQLPAESRNMVTGVGIVVAVVLLLFAFLYFLIGRKIQRGRQWARVLVLIFCVLGILSTAANLLLLAQADAQGSALLSASASFIGPVLFIILLNTSAARSWFKHQTY